MRGISLSHGLLRASSALVENVFGCVRVQELYLSAWSTATALESCYVAFRQADLGVACM